MADMSNQENQSGGFNPGPPPEHYKKFEITSQHNPLDIRNQVNLPGGQPRSPDDDQRHDEEEARRKWENEQTTRYRRAEFDGFHERNNPTEVRYDAGKLVGLWLDQWYRRGESPYDFLVEAAIRSAHTRVEHLTDSIPNGYYQPTQEDRDSKLIAGTFWQPAPLEMVLNDEVAIAERPDGKKVWVSKKDSRVLGLYKTNSAEVAIGKNIGVDVKPTFYIGTEVSSDEAEENREKLAEELTAQTVLIEAWSNLFKKVQEQDIFSTDIDAYMDQEFVRLGKVIMRGWAYAEILNAPPSRERFAPFGEKIIVAHEAWREVIEGKAVAKVGLKNPTKENPDNIDIVEGAIPNPFAYAKNQGLMNLALRYVESRVAAEKPSKISETRRNGKHFKRAEEKDNTNAALAALLLVDHFDEDAEAAIQFIRRGGKDDVVFEIAFVDSSKAAHPRERMQKEYLGYTLLAPNEAKRNPHPRETGSGIALQFLPNLVSHFLEETLVDVLAKNGNDNVKEISVTLDQITGGAKQNGERVVIERDGKKYSQVRIAKKSGNVDNNEEIWEYQLTTLADRKLWDNISFPVNGEDGLETVGLHEITSFEGKKSPGNTSEVLEFLEGTNSIPYEVPKGLLERYALKQIFKEFLRTDFLQQYENYRSPQFLRSLNKGISLGTKLLVKQYQLSEDTTRDFEEFVRIAMVATCAASVTSLGNKGSKPEQQKHVLEGDTRDNVVNYLERSMLASRFIRAKSTEDGVLSWERDKDKKLFNDIIDERDRAPLSVFAFGYFEKSQEEELKPLYS